MTDQNKELLQLEKIITTTYESYLHIDDGVDLKGGKMDLKNSNFLDNVGTCEVCHQLLYNNILTSKYAYKSFGK